MDGPALIDVLRHLTETSDLCVYARKADSDCRIYSNCPTSVRDDQLGSDINCT